MKIKLTDCKSSKIISKIKKLLYFRHHCNAKHVHILIDNSTALAYINNMGGMHSVICNDIAKRIWEFA